MAEDDWVIEREGVAALIDAMSYQYLMGSEIDYVEGLEAPSLSLTTQMQRQPAAAALLSLFSPPSISFNLDQ